MRWMFFFDGACHLCSREIDHYRKLAGSEKIEFIDIALPDFSALRYGLDPVAVNQEMHVKSPSGEVFTGVDAFIQIWKIFPQYRKYATVANYRAVKPFLKVGYQVFAKLRPYLPKRKDHCEACVVRTDLRK